MGDPTNARDDFFEEYEADSVAVVGMACRFPGASSLQEFWDLLLLGKSAIKKTLSDKESPWVGAQGVLDSKYSFDSSFFGYTPKEAAKIDPQQRKFLECCWSGLEDAGIIPRKYQGLIGVYAGSGMNYSLLDNVLNSKNQLERVLDVLTFISNEKDFLSTRVSHKLDLKGPSLAVQSACSTSLVAVHLGCQSLLSYQTDAAICGGVSFQAPKEPGYYYREGEIFSPTGDLRPFDEFANGTLFGEGVGVVVLKRLSDAVKEKDRIYAVIRGSAVNNDGSQKVGYTAPSAQGQKECISAALELAEKKPSEIGYLETHGTGTSIGDAIEIAGLKQVFGNDQDRERPLALGSVKANIGHLDTAAGIAGFMKTVLILWNRMIPPQINYRIPHPNLQFDNSLFRINTTALPFPYGEDLFSAGVSSFGMGGTNSHVILEEFPGKESGRIDSEDDLLLFLSAGDEDVLKLMVNSLKSDFGMNGHNLKSISYTLLNRRERFSHTWSGIWKAEKRNIIDENWGISEIRTGNEVVFYINEDISVEELSDAYESWKGIPVFEDVYLSCMEKIQQSGKSPSDYVRFTFLLSIIDICKRVKLIPGKAIGSSLESEILAAYATDEIDLNEVVRLLGKEYDSDVRNFYTDQKDFNTKEGNMLITIHQIGFHDFLVRLGILLCKGYDLDLNCLFDDRVKLCSTVPYRFINRLSDPKISSGGDQARKKIVFLFPGQGAQYRNMGKELYEREIVFKENLDLCSQKLKGILGVDIREIIFPCDSKEKKTLNINDTLYTQPVLFSFEYSLAQLLISKGVIPSAMMGHSLGEYSAACLSGVFSLEDALTTVAERGRLAQAMPNGKMATFLTSMENLAPILDDRVCIAAFNAPDLIVLSGLPTDIDDIRSKASEQGIQSIELKTSHPFHSRFIEKAVSPFKQFLEKLSLNSPRIPFISNLTGDWIRDEQACSPEYWANQFTHPVRFTEGLDNLKNGDILFVEVGPGTTLSTLYQKNNAGGDIPPITLIPHPKDNTDSYKYFEKAFTKLTELYLHHIQEKKELTEFPSTVRNLSIKEELEKILCDEIGFETISPSQNFFEMGGHSLIAASIANRINETFGSSISPTLCLNNPLIEDFLINAESEVNKKKETLKIRKDDKPILSSSQERLWFLKQIDPENPAYNLALSLRIEGLLDRSALQEVLKKITCRHQAFSSTIHNCQGVPEIKIESGQTLNYQEMEPVGISSQERELDIKLKIKENTGIPFDYSTPPLYRFILFKISPRDNLLVLIIPHILIDGWSFSIITREIKELYHLYKKNGKIDMDEKYYDYTDYSYWEKAQIGNDKDRVYWKQYLGSVHPQLQFPYDSSRPPIMSSKGNTLFFEVDDITSRKIRQICHEREMTPFVFFLGSLHLLFHYYTAQDEIVIGIPYANRELKEFEDIVGFFINLFPIKSIFSQYNTIEDLFKHIKEGFLGALDHRTLAFDEIINEVGISREININPLFQIMFAFQNYLDEKSDRLNFFEEFTERGLSEYDFSFYMWEDEQTYKGALEYSSILLNRSKVESLLDNYLVLLENIVQNITSKIEEISFLTEYEYKKVTEDWNASSYVKLEEETFLELFTGICRENPNACAIETVDRKIQYNELNKKSDLIAHYLNSRGIGKGDFVGVCMERGIEIVTAILGILKCGAAYIPIDPIYPGERIKYIVENSGINSIVTDISSSSYVKFEGSQIELLNLSGDDWIKALIRNESHPLPLPKAGDDAYIIYTSGSTGTPKGVRIHHSALLNLLKSMKMEPGIKEQDRLLALTTVSFDISILELFLPLITGAAVIMADMETATNPERLAEFIDCKRVSIMQATPATYNMLIHSGWMPKNRIKILCGGEAMSQELANHLVNIGDSLWNMYGPTETTIWSTIFHVEKENQKPLIGKPINNTIVYILNENLLPVPIGVIGELYIGGDGVSKGYYRRDDLTSERFIKNPFILDRDQFIYKTGDLCRFLDNGNIEYVGRADFQVKIRGFRIELGEIEHLLDRIEGVEKAVCTVHEFADGDKRIIAYIKSTLENLDRVFFNTHLRDHLPDYMIPSNYVTIEVFPLTGSGKIDRNALPKPDLVSLASYVQVETLSVIQKNMIAIWEDILKVRNVGLDDNFFHLGGHSILAAKLLHDINEEFGNRWTLYDLFQNPTVRGLLDKNKLEKKDLPLIFSVNKGEQIEEKPFFIVPGIYAEMYYKDDQASSYVDDFLKYFNNILVYLKDRVPVYGLRPKGIYRGESFDRNVSTMAREYIIHIKKVQPHGPYRIGGECLGGLIAYEIASQLLQGGDEVQFLFLSDTYNLTRKIRLNYFKTNLINRCRKIKREIITVIRDKDRLKRRNCIKDYRRVLIPITKKDSEFRHLFWGSQILTDIILRTKIKPITCPVLLVINEEWNSEVKNLGWSPIELMKGDIRIIPGNHNTKLSEHGQTIVEILQEYLGI